MTQLSYIKETQFMDNAALLREASSFYELAELGRIQIPEKKDVESHIPYIVNMSFSAELCLKLLLIHNGNNIKDIKSYRHRLFDLYNNLTDIQKEKIYQSFHRPLIYSIETELQSIDNAVVDWRYLVFEKINSNRKKLQYKPFFIKEFTEILINLCSNLK